MLAPFLHDLYLGALNVSEDVSVVDGLVALVEAKEKEFRAKFPALKVVWLLPYCVDFKKICKNNSYQLENQDFECDKLRNSFNLLLHELKVEMNLIDSIFLNPEKIMTVSLSENGITLSQSCCDALSKCIADLIPEIRVDEEEQNG